MQKLLLAFSFLFISSLLHAQLDKGQWLIGGFGSFSAFKVANANSLLPDSKYRSLSLNAGPGYFVKDKLALGARINYSYSSSTFYVNQEYKSTINVIGAAPFVRYYFLAKQKKINLLADVAYSWRSQKNKVTPGGTGSETSSQFQFAAGPVWFITPQTALELTVGYSGREDNVKPELNVNLGFQIHLPVSKGKK
jgi:hypothetical protein